jgi:hypothetical protein
MSPHLGFLLILPHNIKTTNMRVRLPLPHNFRQNLGECFGGFLILPLSFLPFLLCCSTWPFISSSLQYIRFLYTLLSLKYSKKVTCKGGLDENFVRREGNHLFFLSMYLYLLLNKDRLCLDVEYSYPNIF